MKKIILLTLALSVMGVQQNLSASNNENNENFSGKSEEKKIVINWNESTDNCFTNGFPKGVFGELLTYFDHQTIGRFMCASKKINRQINNFFETLSNNNKIVNFGEKELQDGIQIIELCGKEAKETGCYKINKFLNNLTTKAQENPEFKIFLQKTLPLYGCLKNTFGTWNVAKVQETVLMPLFDSIYPELIKDESEDSLQLKFQTICQEGLLFESLPIITFFKFFLEKKIDIDCGMNINGMQDTTVISHLILGRPGNNVWGDESFLCVANFLLRNAIPVNKIRGGFTLLGSIFITFHLQGNGHKALETIKLLLENGADMHMTRFPHMTGGQTIYQYVQDMQNYPQMSEFIEVFKLFEEFDKKTK